MKFTTPHSPTSTPSATLSLFRSTPVSGSTVRPGGLALLASPKSNRLVTEAPPGTFHERLMRALSRRLSLSTRQDQNPGEITGWMTTQEQGQTT
jgi:hypothetical protein